MRLVFLFILLTVGPVSASWHLCPDVEWPSVQISDSPRVRLTVYETRLDSDTGRWHVLFVLDRVMRDGHLHPYNNTRDDDFGYSHMTTGNVHQWLLNTTRGAFDDTSLGFRCSYWGETGVHPELEVAGDWIWTDSWYRLSCPWPQHPYPPHTEHGFTLTVHLKESSLPLEICSEPELPPVEVALCGSILLDTAFLEQIVPHIEYHRSIGIGRFYVFDRTGLYYDILEPFILARVVLYYVFPLRDWSLETPGRRYVDQYQAVEKCRYLATGKAQWIISVDMDEWIVLHPPYTTIAEYLNQPLVPVAPARSMNPDDNVTEPIYDWWIPINPYIFNGRREPNSSHLPMTEQFLYRQPYMRHPWGFKAFLRPQLPIELIERWAQRYLSRRPYALPERDVWAPGQSSYMTMHKADHMHFDDPRVRPPEEIGFAHYNSFVYPRNWTNGLPAIIRDETLANATRRLKHDDVKAPKLGLMETVEVYLCIAAFIVLLWLISTASHKHDTQPTNSIHFAGDTDVLLPLRHYSSVSGAEKET
jgi:hypothetical protein